MSIRIEETKDAKLLSKLNFDVQEIHHKIEPMIFKSHSFENMTKLFEEALSDTNVFGFAAYFENDPAGYILITKRVLPETYFKYSYSVVYIEQICVEKSYLGKGIGKALIDKAKDFAHDNGIRRIELDFWYRNDNAGRFFRSQGFSTYNEKMCLEI